jgi:glycosyltransferase involved in cell wall biosynthesis
MRKKIMIVMKLSSIDGGRSLGGVDTVCQTQLQGLIRFGGEHEYLILALNPANDTPVCTAGHTMAPNLTVFWRDYARQAQRVGIPNVLANEFLVRKFIEKHQPDVVHSHLPCWHIRKYCLEKKILTLHQFGDLGRTPVNYFNDLLHKKLIEPYSCRTSDIITSVSKDITRFLRAGTDTQIRYIPNPIPDVSASPSRDVSGEGLIRLVLVANVSRRKRVLDAVRTMQILKSNYPRIKLVIVGRGGTDQDYENEIASFVKAHQLAENIEFAGLLSRQELAVELGKSHLSVFFSDSETFGLGPLECLTAGVPLITTNVGVFTWHKCDFERRGVDIVPVGDIQAAANAISRRINRQEFSVQPALQDYLRQNFSLKACTDMYVEAYESV